MSGILLSIPFLLWGVGMLYRGISIDASNLTMSGSLSLLIALVLILYAILDYWLNQRDN